MKTLAESRARPQPALSISAATRESHGAPVGIDRRRVQIAVTRTRLTDSEFAAALCEVGPRVASREVGYLRSGERETARLRTLEAIGQVSGIPVELLQASLPAGMTQLMRPRLEAVPAGKLPLPGECAALRLLLACDRAIQRDMRITFPDQRDFERHIHGTWVTRADLLKNAGSSSVEGQRRYRRQVRRLEREGNQFLQSIEQLLEAGAWTLRVIRRPKPLRMPRSSARSFPDDLVRFSFTGTELMRLALVGDQFREAMARAMAVVLEPWLQGDSALDHRGVLAVVKGLTSRRVRLSSQTN